MLFRSHQSRKGLKHVCIAITVRNGHSSLRHFLTYYVTTMGCANIARRPTLRVMHTALTEQLRQSNAHETSYIVAVVIVLRCCVNLQEA